MSSNQRKTVLVVVDRAGRANVPALDVVTLFAVGAHLPAVEIGVAIGAAGSGIRENRLGVAACTRHIFMHAKQRIRSLVVVKFWNGSNGLPTDGRMAVLTRHVQRAVRTARSLTIACLSIAESQCPAKKQTCEQQHPEDC